MPGLLAFFATPLGQAIAAEIPGYVGKVIAIWVRKGRVSEEELADYIAEQWLDPASLIHPKKGTTP